MAADIGSGLHIVGFIHADAAIFRFTVLNRSQSPGRPHDIRVCMSSVP